MMKLIADAGSTKATWILADDKVGTPRRQIVTQGLNALVMDAGAIRNVLVGQLLPETDSARIEQVWYYGAGCIGGEVNRAMRGLLAEVLQCDNVEVAGDMLLAARSLCGHDPGIACILGTGSNSCFYDGENIADNVPPLGYILGDEGSGAVIGRRLLGDVFKRRLPEPVAARFLEWVGMTYAEIIERVYRQPGVNAFLASLMPFVAENIAEPAIESLVTGSFVDFIERNVANYPDWQRLPVNFAGSVAYVFQRQLESACRETGCHPGIILRYPAENIADFHLNKPL